MSYSCSYTITNNIDTQCYFDFGAITFAVKGSLSGQELYVYPVNENGEKVGLARPVSAYLHGGAIPSDWQVAWVPLNDLIQRPVQGSFTFNGIGIEATMPGTVWLDEVKVVEGFRLPLAGDKTWKVTVGAGGSETHAADAAYYSLDFAARTLEDNNGNTQLPNVPILASAGGKVVAVGNDSMNGNYIRIDHDYDGDPSTGITTWYLHMEEKPTVSVGITVKQGQHLGMMGNTGASGGKHLHFQFTSEGSRTKDDAPMLHFVEMEGIRIEDYQAGSFYPSSNLIVQ